MKTGGIPSKRDARKPAGALMTPEVHSDAFSQKQGLNREEARQRLEELERGLTETLAADKQASPALLLRRYYLPMLEAALVANALEQADRIRKMIAPEDVPDSDKPHWWQAVCQTLLRLYRLNEAKAEAQGWLTWTEQSGQRREEAEANGNLGDILYTLGDFQGARACFERALQIDEAAYGPDHPNVTRNVNNLGRVMRDQGDLAGARAHFERALQIDEAAHGPNHPNVARDVNNLGKTLHDQGDLAGAQAHLERALQIYELACGPNHPSVATNINNLGRVLQDQGDLAGAQACFERALQIDEAAYGPNHPNVAIRVNNLGGVLRAQNNSSGARACYERARAIFRQFLGEDHPNTKTVAGNLASLGK